MKAIKYIVTVLTMLMGVQGVMAASMQDKLQARRDLSSMGLKYSCHGVVVAANKGEVVEIDAYIRAGIDKNCT